MFDVDLLLSNYYVCLLRPMVVMFIQGLCQLEPTTVVCTWQYIVVVLIAESYQAYIEPKMIYMFQI
jgi:hypothetical protein